MILRLSKCYTLLVLLTLGCIHLAQAQLTDLARLEYSFIPSSKSEDQYTRLRASLNYPIKIKNKDYLIIGGEYNRILLNLEDEYSFNTHQLKKLHVIDFSLGYTFKTSEKWRLGIQITPRIASTLTSKLTTDDMFLNGGVFAIKDRRDAKDIDKPYRLVLGLTYNSTTGVPFPLPFVSYFRRVNEKWSYSIGVPKSNVKYFFNEKSILQTFAGLDGYFANIQQPITVNEQVADNISLSVALGGLGYEYCFTKHLIAYSYIGYTFLLSNHLRDDNRDNVYKLNDLNAFYFRSGIKFKI
ncbi:DUF6268 family outer membrane beta-barrel protein [uncultured Winogradskyella sp.]|uniref:DUF6268 family outer membrane beta-barrel protein n=1 Tax=uncultured Winogradskyella sp. TaxID=395353 RepID=UPI00262CF62E|nr:DUF6268 family outer membrane beta-barrel protein [uncultured Winogradskyella sp.]|tara:strand:+ start:747 stop:1637 length:891 start_codon:yes stop_codon:yes gene_type:complete